MKNALTIRINRKLKLNRVLFVYTFYLQLVTLKFYCFEKFIFLAFVCGPTSSSHCSKNFQNNYTLACHFIMLFHFREENNSIEELSYKINVMMKVTEKLQESMQVTLLVLPQKFLK
jgi:hypothetical protein